MRSVALLLALVSALAINACQAVIDAVPEGGPIPANLAEDYARLSAGVSVASIEVVSSRLSTYEAERPGGTATAPDTQVWVVVLKGAFPYGSCDVGPLFASASPGTTYKPCPAPAVRQQILLNARSGRFIERIIPG